MLLTEVANNNLAGFAMRLSPLTLTYYRRSAIPYAAIAPAARLAESLWDSLAAATIQLQLRAILQDLTGCVFASLEAAFETDSRMCFLTPFFPWRSGLSRRETRLGLEAKASEAGIIV